MSETTTIDRMAEREEVRAAMLADQQIATEIAAATQALTQEKATLMAPIRAARDAMEICQNDEITTMRARHTEEREAMRARHYDEHRAAYTYDAATKARLDGIAAEVEQIEAPFEARREALWETVKADWLNCHDGEDPQLCAATGLPLLDGDDLLIDEDAGEAVLRAAIPGLAPKPPKPVDEAADEDGVVSDAAAA